MEIINVFSSSGPRFHVRRPRKAIRQHDAFDPAFHAGLGQVPRDIARGRCFSVQHCRERGRLVQGQGSHPRGREVPVGAEKHHLHLLEPIRKEFHIFTGKHNIIYCAIRNITRSIKLSLIMTGACVLCLTRYTVYHSTQRICKVTTYAK